MLESYGEGAGNPEGYVHYCNGGLPGYFPPIAGRAGFGQVGFNAPISAEKSWFARHRRRDRVSWTAWRLRPNPSLPAQLYDPFNWFDAAYPGKDKARGRQVEINNGRLAMLGIFSLLSESAAPGAVRRGVPGIFVYSSLDSSIARRHAIAAASSQCLIRAGPAAHARQLHRRRVGPHGAQLPVDRPPGHRHGRRLGLPQLLPAVHAAGRPLHRHGRLAVLDAGQRAARRRRQLGHVLGKATAPVGGALLLTHLYLVFRPCRRRRDT